MQLKLQWYFIYVLLFIQLDMKQHRINRQKPQIWYLQYYTVSVKSWFKRFTGESFRAAVLDSEANKTVCSKKSIQCYTESLNEKAENLVKNTNSQNILKFGDGKKFKSLQTKSIDFC